jgi:hypothetical protein
LSSEDMTEVWAARISDYLASGETVVAWCEGMRLPRTNSTIGCVR